MRPRPRDVATSLAVLATVLLAACGGGGGDADDEEDRPVSSPPRVVETHGERSVVLDAAALAKSGVASEALETVTHRTGEIAFGSVLDLTDLADQRGGLQSAAAAVDGARAALAASRAEYERVKALHNDQRIVSDEDLQAAKAAYERDVADVQAADAALEARSATARQQWGDAIAGWIERGSPTLRDLLRQRERLLLITLPAGTTASPPGTAALLASGRSVGSARLVSPAPRTDPRIQGPSFYYVAPATPDLLPGTSVTLSVARGAPVAGVVVPEQAVVWWHGRAWAYVETGKGTFVRREIATDTPVAPGYFVTAGVAPGERVVVRGAAVLLSEEGRGAVHGSEG